MRLTIVKAYLQAILGGLVILAVVVLVLLQWGNTGAFSFYGKNIEDANTALLVLASAAGGLAMWWIVKWFAGGVRVLVRSRRQAERPSPRDPSGPAGEGDR